MAKKVKTAAKVGRVVRRKGRGGRRRGEWEVVKEGALEEFRKTQQLSRGKVAKLLGVSPTTIQNWETGKAVPTKKSQGQLAALMKGGATAEVSAAPSAGSSAAHAHGNGSAIAAQLTATSEILKSFLATPAGSKLTADRLVALAQSLRTALA